MGEEIGAQVWLEKAPLKYEGLSYTEIWISEAQERMILAVPSEHWERLEALCAGEDVEATVIGTFEPTAMCRISMPSSISASSKENEQPMAKVTKSSRQTSRTSVGSATSSPFRHTR